MKAAVYSGPAEHQSKHAIAMREGLERHGINVTFYRGPGNVPRNVDFVATWGWRNGRAIHNAGIPVLVMERGYIGDRFNWTSLGWNGLNGRAQWNAPADTGERFEKNFSHLLKNWKQQQGYALIIGQVKGDASLYNTNIDIWYEKTRHDLDALGYDVKFRAHPVAVQRGQKSVFPSLEGSLQKAIDGAAIVVSYNSNTGVEAVLNGTPTYTADMGAMAYDVTSHELGDIITPERKEWLTALSWKQWTIDEIINGTAWEVIKDVPIRNIPENNASCLVIGGANSVWDDIVNAYDLGTFDYVIALNNSIADYPGRVDIAMSLHPKKLAGWLKERDSKNYPNINKVVGHIKRDRVTEVFHYLWPEMKYSGSSGHYACMYAIDVLKCNRVVLAGVPMSQAGQHYHSREAWKDCDLFLPAWKQSFARLDGIVKSFGGWTSELLGTPDRDWFNG